MKYFLTIGSKKYDFASLEFERSVGLESTVGTFLIQAARGSTLPANGDAVLIEKEIGNISPKLLKWGGKVQKVAYVPGKANHIKITAYDYSRKINYLKTIALGYNATKGSSIISTEAGPSSATTDLTLGTIDTTDSSISSVAFGKKEPNSSIDSKITRKSAFDIIAMISDRDVYIKRDGTLDFANGAGIDRHTTHIFEHGLNGVLVDDVGYSEDEIRRVKKVTVKGLGIGSAFFIAITSAGDYASTDKERQFEFPFLQDQATCQTVADKLLLELNQIYKFAQFQLLDLFQTNWDIFDTIRLKAKFPNKNIDENLKVVKIKTMVQTSGSDFHELVTVDLSNFRRGVFAKMSHPQDAAEDNVGRIEITTGTTQAQMQLSPQSIQQVISSVGVSQGTINSYVTLVSGIAFNSKNTVKSIFIIDLEIISNKDGTDYDFFQINVYDGTTSYPGTDAQILFIPYNGKKTHRQVTIEVPSDSSNKTYSIRGKCTNSGAEVDINCIVLAYSVGM
jgi:hypothetical protein